MGRSRGSREPGLEVAVGDVDADRDVGLELDAFVGHELDPPVHDPLFELEVGDAVAEDAAGPVALVVDHHAVAELVEDVGHRESGRAGADDRHPLAAADRRGARLHVAPLEAGLDDRLLNLPDGDGLPIAQFEHAGGLAGGRADATGELGEGVGAQQDVERLLPLAPVGHVVEFGNDVADRAAGAVAEGDAAAHAAGRLLVQVLVGEPLLHRPVVADALFLGPVARLLPVELEKSAYLTHRSPLHGQSARLRASSDPARGGIPWGTP